MKLIYVAIPFLVYVSHLGGMDRSSQDLTREEVKRVSAIFHETEQQNRRNSGEHLIDIPLPEHIPGLGSNNYDVRAWEIERMRAAQDARYIKTGCCVLFAWAGTFFSGALLSGMLFWELM